MAGTNRAHVNMYLVKRSVSWPPIVLIKLSKGQHSVASLRRSSYSDISPKGHGLGMLFLIGVQRLNKRHADSNVCLCGLHAPYRSMRFINIGPMSSAL